MLPEAQNAWCSWSKYLPSKPLIALSLLPLLWLDPFQAQRHPSSSIDPLIQLWEAVPPHALCPRNNVLFPVYLTFPLSGASQHNTLKTPLPACVPQLTLPLLQSNLLIPLSSLPFNAPFVNCPCGSAIFPKRTWIPFVSLLERKFLEAIFQFVCSQFLFLCWGLWRAIDKQLEGLDSPGFLPTSFLAVQGFAFSAE